MPAGADKLVTAIHCVGLAERAAAKAAEADHSGAQCPEGLKVSTGAAALGSTRNQGEPRFESGRRLPCSMPSSVSLGAPQTVVDWGAVQYRFQGFLRDRFFHKSPH
jgi:hypothetical protein